jgi:hypothetical protein
MFKIKLNFLFLMRIASLTLCENTSFSWLSAVCFFFGTSCCNIQQKKVCHHWYAPYSLISPVHFFYILVKTFPLFLANSTKIFKDFSAKIENALSNSYYILHITYYRCENFPTWFLQYFSISLWFPSKFFYDVLKCPPGIPFNNIHRILQYRNFELIHHSRWTFQF